MESRTVERKLQCLDRYRTKHIHVGKVIVANDRNVVDGACTCVQVKKIRGGMRLFRNFGVEL